VPRVIRGAFGLASFGLAFNLFLCSIPVVVAAAAMPHAIFGNSAPSLAQALDNTQQHAGLTPSLADALIQLVAAESEALHVAGEGLQSPPPANLGQQADHAGNRVKDAVTAYVRAAQNALDHAPKP
jgi:hypothetical protein